MGRRIRCPNCGGETELANPGITMVICQYCKTVVYWGEDQVLKAGTQSILPEADTRLFMYAGGTLVGRGYTVIGHLCYDHGRGRWDEWYLQFDDGRVAWVSEDGRELSLERPVSAQGAPSFAQLAIGNAVQLGQTAFSVRETGTATCIGGEGQLPFAILPGETYPYADIASIDGQHFATLEYDEDHATASCFVGQPLTHEQLTVEGEAPPSTASATSGKGIQCGNCAAALESPSGREVQTLVCEYCGAQIDLTSAEANVLGINPKDFDPGFCFDIGQGGTFSGKRYEVCGRMLYQDLEGYRSREYLLHNPDAGYLWLAQEDGHFVLNRPTRQAPNTDPMALPPKAAVTIGPTGFRVFESGFSNLVFVDGALPWIASCGDQFRYADLIAPPQMFGVETDGTEIEYFHGRYLKPSEVAQAFQLDRPPARPIGVHAAQPFERGAVMKLVMLFGAIFALVNIALLGWSLSKRGRIIFAQNFESAAYLRETLSEPFNVGPEKVMAMSISAPLRNSWLALEVGLVNADKQQVVMEVDGNEISYYSGYEGGESWSEGNRSNTTYFQAPPPGRYQLILKGAGGTGNFSGSPPGREPLQIRVQQGVVLSRFFVFALVLTGLFPFFGFLRKRLFEQRRWAAVLEDDDDDDDD